MFICRASMMRKQKSIAVKTSNVRATSGQMPDAVQINVLSTTIHSLHMKKGAIWPSLPD